MNFFHQYNMTCMCEKCNQKRVIDCLFAKVDANLHIDRKTQLFLTVNVNAVWKDGGKLPGKQFLGRIVSYTVNIYC